MKQLIKNKSRRPATLLELLIAMGLMMAILSTLAYFYRQINSISSATEVQQHQLFNELYLSTRITDMLPKALPPNGSTSFFYTSKSHSGIALNGTPELIFSFENGIKLDPQFSNNALGRLFIDRKNRLCLVVWPSPELWDESRAPPMKCQILMEKVRDISYRFYIPPTKDWEKVWKQKGVRITLAESFPQTSSGEWMSEWQEEWLQLPAMTEIIITPLEGNNIILTYPMPNSNFMVVY